MTKYFLSILIILFFQLLKAQKESSYWYFGGDPFSIPLIPGPGLHFDSTEVEVLSDGALSSTEPAAAISDKNGNLLFYTNGVTVWNTEHTIMLNGDSLLTCISTTQGVIIINKPLDENKYYIFTIGDCGENFLGTNVGLRYSIVDMTLDGGRGGVILSQKNVNIIYDVTEKMVAVNHCNGIDKWLLVHEKNNTNFLAYQLTDTGLIAPVISSIGINHTFPHGQMKFSPDGRKLAVAIYKQSRIQLFDFDNSTGIVSNPIDLQSNADEYGVSFSPDNSKLYFTNPRQSPGIKTKLVQYDIASKDPIKIYNSRTDIFSTDVFLALNGMQLALDGKIYVNRLNPSDSIAVIHYPNKKGTACGLEFNALSTNGVKTGFTFPSFNESYFNINNISFEFNNYPCINDTVYFEMNTWTDFDSIAWDLGDNTSMMMNTHMPKHTYSNAGIYQVTLYIIDKCIIDTIVKTIEVKDGFEINLPDTILCKEESIAISLADIKDSIIYTIWSNGDTGLSTTINLEGSYTVELANNCLSIIDTFVVNNNTECDIFFIPNAFSPNSDGINDVLDIYGSFSNFLFNVYDRRGQLLYSTSSQLFWNGISQNKKVHPGTYIYKFYGQTTKTKKEINQTGTINLFSE